MATVQEAIKRLRYEFTSQGADKTAADLNKVNQAHAGIASTSSTAERATLSLEKQFGSLERRYNSVLREQQNFERVQRQVNAAVAQNPALQQRAGVVLDMARQRYVEATEAVSQHDSALGRLANTLTRRVVYAFLIREARELTQALFNLNSELAKTGDIAARTGIGGGAFQGLSTAAAFKGIGAGQFADDMLKFSQRVDEARAGVGDLAKVLRVNGLTVADTRDAFGKVADLVRNAASEAQKFSILQQAGLPATREYVRLLEQGRETIESQAEAARKLSDPQLAAAQRTEDRWNEMWANFTRFAKAAVVNTVDALGQVDDKLTKIDVKNDRALQGALLRGGGSRMTQSHADDFYRSTGAVAGTAPDTKKTADPARAQQLLDIERQRISILGSLASIEDVVRGKEIDIDTARKNGITVTQAQKQALLELTRAQELGVTAIQQQIDASRIEAATLGMAIGPATAYRLEWEKRLEAQRNGRTLSEEEIERLRRTATEAGSAAESLARLKNAFQSVNDSATLFGTTFVQAMLQGKNGAEALQASMKQLASSLASSAITDLLSGNFVAAGLKGAAAVALTLFDDSEEKKREEEEARKQHEAAEEGKRRSQEFTMRRQLVGVDTSTFDGALKEFDLQKNVRRNEEARAGGHAMAELEALMAAERLDIIKKFTDAAIVKQKEAEKVLSGEETSAVAARLEEIDAAAKSLSSALTDLGQSTGSVAAKVAQAVDKLRASFLDDISRKINSASGKGHLNEISDLIKETTQMAKDAAALGADPSSIQRYLQLQAQQIVEGADLTGAAFQELITLFPQLAGAVHQATDGIAKTIDDFLNGLQFGQLSTLSQADQFGAARSRFDEQFTLAQGGDLAARGGITQTADQFLQLARSFLGPSDAYRLIYEQVTGQLRGLAGGGIVDVAGGMSEVAGGAVPGGAPGAPASVTTLPIRTGLTPSNDNQDVVAELRALRRENGAILTALANAAGRGNELAADLLREIGGLRVDTRLAAGEQSIRAEA